MEFTPALAASARYQHGVLTAAQLDAAGYTEDRIRRLVAQGFLERVHRKLLVVAGSPATRRRQIAIAALAARPLGGASHRTGAELFGMRSVDEEIDVSIRYPRRLTVDGARVVRSRDLQVVDLTWVDGIPVTTPERTICDLGLIFPETEVMRILRHAVATGMVDRSDVVRMRIRISQHGRNGAGVAGRCLDRLPELAEQTESGIEALFLELCEQHGVEPPQLQVPVMAAGRLRRVDFAYVAERIFVEIDGRASHGGLDQIAADGGRQNDLVAAGWLPIRFTSDQLRTQPESCIATVRRTRRLRICDPAAAA